MKNNQDYPNPFFAKTPVQGKTFFGREELLKKLFYYINAGESVSLVGERRTGKTSVLGQLRAVNTAYLNQANTHLLVYVDFQGLQGHSETEIWESILSALVDEGEDAPVLHNFITQNITQLQSGKLAFQSLLRVFRRIAKEHVRVTFLFDEFEATARGEKPLDIRFYKMLRNLALDQGTQVSYVIATRQELSRVEKTVELHYTTLSSPLFNIFHQLVILPFSEDEARQMVNSLLQRAGLDLAAKLSFWLQKDLLFELSGFHPFFLQLACRQLFDQCVREDGSFIDEVPEDTIRSGFLQDASADFNYYWEISTPEERDVLIQLATQEETLVDSNRYLLNTLRNRCLVVRKEVRSRRLSDDSTAEAVATTLFSSAFKQWIREQHVRESGKAEQLPVDYFVGRKDELDAFRRCLTSQTQNGIYFYGDGGIGKSMLLRRIFALCENELHYHTIFIDFFSTKNRSIEGVQNSIIEKFPESHAFDEMLQIREKVNDIRTGAEFSYRKEMLSGLQRQLEVMFARCCNEAAQERPVALIFDSFEYIQKRDIGRWFLGEVLPYLKKESDHGIIVVLAGRPQPKIATTPANILQYRLEGLTKPEVKDYIQQKMNMPWEEVLEPLYQGIQGNPLILELLRWRGRRELLTDTQRLQEMVDKPEVMAQEIFDKISEISPLNRVLWAMAVFKRRFDFDMLEFLVDNMLWLRNADYEALRHALRALPFVKSAEDTSSHLLHDAVVKPISLVFRQVDKEGRLRKELFQKIVREYYPERVEEVQAQDERMFLQTEQSGYILDQDLEEGIAQYKSYLEDIRQQRQYDFEALLWGEVDEHVPAENVALRLERANWLLNNGLHRSLETLSRGVYTQENIEFEDRLSASQYLGFALMRQGKLQEAEEQFQESLKLAQQVLQSDTRIAETANNLGQVAALAGKYQQAAEYYWQSIRRFSGLENMQRLASVYSARGHSLARLGDYNRALIHCRCALQILEKYPEVRRQLYALRDLGIVYRFAGDYDVASLSLKQARREAEKEKFIELEASILQELAYTYYWRGRHAREQKQNYSSDCNNQAKALQTVQVSLERSRTIGHRIYISESFVLFGHIIEEIVTLQDIQTNLSKEELRESSFPILLLKTLLKQTQELQVPEDIFWLQDRQLQHFPDKSFTELALLGKAVRLFELGSLEALEVNQIHVVIESQTELARILLQLKAWEDVEIRIESIKQTPSGSYNTQALLALGTLIQADFAFDHGDLGGALTRYALAIPTIAQAEWKAINLVETRMHELIKRIKLIKEKKTALDWCRTLQESWLDAKLDTSFPSIIERIQILSHELLGDFSL